MPSIVLTKPAVEENSQARGRVRRFQKSYRTPIEIGFIAQETLPQAIKELIGKFDEFLATKEFIGTHGIFEFILSRSRDEEYRKLADKLAIFLRLLKKS